MNKRKNNNIINKDILITSKHLSFKSIIKKIINICIFVLFAFCIINIKENDIIKVIIIIFVYSLVFCIFLGVISMIFYDDV